MPGPITLSEFLTLWQSVTDEGYSRPFIEQGEGAGLEAHTQAFHQMERVSQAIDRTTQAMYLLPFSGQTDEPSRVGAFATVTLELRRTSRFELGIVLERGTLVEEVATDAGPLGGIPVATGRRYLLRDRVAFAPGEAGPLTVTGIAERFGYGYNNPLEETLTLIVQPGAGLTNDRASVVPGQSMHELVLRAEPDVITFDQVFQYVEFIGGANAGQIRWVTGYGVPLLAPPTGGTAIISAMGIYRLLAITGSLIVDEVVEQPATGATGVLIAQTGTHVFIQRTSAAASFATGLLCFGTQSATAFVLELVEQGPDLAAETGAATWRVLSWATDLGVTCTNPEKPSGGRAPMLEELASERSVYPILGESEVQFRKRATEATDTVSPNALLRTANRILAQYGGEGCLREVGYPKLRGLFFDGDPTSTDPAIAFAFDLDFTVRPEDTWKVLLDYIEFRAFFLMGVPDTGLGEFGIAFDAGAYNAFDAAPYLVFFDGYALTASAIYSRIWQDLYRARAGGVGFDLYAERFGCI